MDISVIIINWNSKAYVRECCKSIYHHTKGIDFEVIVLDNASWDGCGEMLTTEFPQVRFVQSKENLGFARGNNCAFKHSKGKILVFLNPDTELKNTALNKLYEAVANKTHVGAVGARLLNSDGTIQTSCVQSFPTLANHILDSEFLRKRLPRSALWGNSVLFSKSQNPVQIDSVSGACIAVSRKVFEEVGGFSEDFFMYYEDTDFCFKISKTDRVNYYLSEAIIVHHGGKSSGGGASRFSSVVTKESAWRFFYKERGAAYATIFRVATACAAICRVCLLTIPLIFASSKIERKRVINALKKWQFVISWALGAEKQLAGEYLPKLAQ